eukprot:XP_001692643.1 predicted protein [Chlamydomonas reinhardtii]
MTHRPALLDSGLQRCELGGIASRIGQLYYNSATPSSKDGQGDCLLQPDELLVASRRRLLLVVDSDMAPDFARLPAVLDEVLLTLGRDLAQHAGDAEAYDEAVVQV